MTRIDPYQPIFDPGLEGGTHLPEEVPGTFVPKPKQQSKEERRTELYGNKTGYSRQGSANSPSTSSTTSRKPSERAQRDRSDVRSQDKSANRTDTVTAQAVHEKSGSGQQGKGGGSGGNNGSSGVAAVVQSSAAQELDYLINELVPMTANDGLFEVYLPDGERLGIAITVGAGHVDILLSPGSGRLAERLRKRRMELKAGLEQRIRRDVMITVL